MFNVTGPARRPLENARLAGVYRFLILMTLPNVDAAQLKPWRCLAQPLHPSPSIPLCSLYSS